MTLRLAAFQKNLSVYFPLELIHQKRIDFIIREENMIHM
jgi:hypothetical protein